MPSMIPDFLDPQTLLGHTRNWLLESILEPVNAKPDTLRVWRTLLAQYTVSLDQCQTRVARFMKI